ncbi:hypothetical protein MRBLWO14_001603 [Microbacterium sp. LWO14-1.2]|uniref:hypothetical protein n=1 Tax=Microbacterium sp. LWO14-1.2 TaxID=3135263 RepID=UPI003139606D
MSSEIRANGDRRVFRVVCNVVILAGLVAAPLLVLGILPDWVGSALFLFALMWVAVGATLPGPRRESSEGRPSSDGSGAGLQH